MRDVMLFGNGWNGEVRRFDEGLQQIRYIPNLDDPHLREVLFTVFGYQSNNGRGYWIGYSGNEPLLPDVERAILVHAPKPMD